MGNLVRAAPEHVRPVSAVEAQLIREPCSEMADLLQKPPCPTAQDGTEPATIPIPADQSEFRVGRQNHESNNSRSHNEITINDQVDNNNQEITSTPQSISSQQPDQEPDMENPAEENVHQALRTALETPVPETDDELLCDMLTCTDAEVFLTSEPHENLAWRFELDMPQNIPEENTIPIDDLILLATNQKKQRTEVKLSHLTMQEQEEFEKAKASEVNNWLQTGTVSKALRSKSFTRADTQVQMDTCVEAYRGQSRTRKTEQNEKSKVQIGSIGIYGPRTGDNSPGQSNTRSSVPYAYTPINSFHDVDPNLL